MIPSVDFGGKVKFGVHSGEAFDIDSTRPTNLIAVNREISRKHIQDHVKFIDARIPGVEVGCLYAVIKQLPIKINNQMFLGHRRQIICCGQTSNA